MTVTVIIPVFGAEHYLTACLDALELNTLGWQYDLTLVNNGMTYDIPNRGCPNDVLALHSSINQGFARANNDGARLADTDLLLFLNMDTEVQPGWLPPLLAALDDPEMVMAGPRVIHPDGSLEGTGIHTWHGEGSAGGTVVREDLPTRDVDGVGGVCMLIRAETFHELGGFDEDYLNGYEDVDLCLKAREKGYRIRFVAESLIVHHGGVSPGRWDHAAENEATMQRKWAWR